MAKSDDKEKSRILLIDDDTSLLVTLGDFLEFEGYEVVTAESGEQGLGKLKEMTPDLIILDMSMPGMGGVGFLKRISSPSGKPKYPVLVLTARANMAEFFADVEVDGFVAKPCAPDDLLMEVGRIIFLRKGSGGPAAEQNVKKRRVLLGEGDERENKALVQALADAGYVADGVLKGPEVLESAIVQRPDVILMKVLLPNMNGDAVAKLLQEMPNTRRIPVVLYGEDVPASSESRFTGPGSGVKLFVNSTRVESLLAAVEKALGK